jgi:hypothetical protein
MALLESLPEQMPLVPHFIHHSLLTMFTCSTLKPPYELSVIKTLTVQVKKLNSSRLNTVLELLSWGGAVL